MAAPTKAGLVRVGSVEGDPLKLITTLQVGVPKGAGQRQQAAHAPGAAHVAHEGQAGVGVVGLDAGALRLVVGHVVLAELDRGVAAHQHDAGVPRVGSQQLAGALRGRVMAGGRGGCG